MNKSGKRQIQTEIPSLDLLTPVCDWAGITSHPSHHQLWESKMEWGAGNGGRTLPYSFQLIWSPRKLRLLLEPFTPGRWHSPSSTRTWIKPCSRSLIFSQSTSCPQGPQPQLCTPSPWDVLPALPANTHRAPREGQELQGPECLQEFCSSGTESIRDWQCQHHTHLELSASHPSGEHNPQSMALHWLGLLLRPFYALNKQNQSPRVKTRLQLL